MTTRHLHLLPALLLLAGGSASAAGTGEDLTVLSYHEVVDPAQALQPAYAVTPTDFVRQMDWLRNHGYRFVNVGEVIASRQGGRALPERAVLIT
ncbi:MAG TPA: poly-beta-1,6-N-acetyl-D-glucosamine N-deacetylase PgaB, partial [Anaeromyxobacteraceae bacterium]|nr:poly-beta-1,6-N-acetyl-D-glucosamine N-deacetylase PgaB [Anaeromyxobacteraceae bacterium]